MTPINSSVVGGLENGSVLSFFSLLGGGVIETTDSIYSKYGKDIPYL